jgi:hypothetical protein
MLALGSVMVALLAGCTSARDTLGTSASSCFEALAVAGNAVHHQGTFAGVRSVSFSSVSADVHLGNAPSTTTALSKHNVCVVSYHGLFSVNQVEKPLGPAPPGGLGHYAIVIVSNPQNHLVGTVVRLTQPLRFDHPL